MCAIGGQTAENSLKPAVYDAPRPRGGEYAPCCSFGGMILEPPSDLRFPPALQLDELAIPDAKEPSEGGLAVSLVLC